jgi:hypothetical protein
MFQYQLSRVRLIFTICDIHLKLVCLYQKRKRKSEFLIQTITSNSGKTLYKKIKHKPQIKETVFLKETYGTERHLWLLPRTPDGPPPWQV